MLVDDNQNFGSFYVLQEDYGIFSIYKRKYDIIVYLT